MYSVVSQYVYGQALWMQIYVHTQMPYAKPAL